MHQPNEERKEEEIQEFRRYQDPQYSGEGEGLVWVWPWKGCSVSVGVIYWLIWCFQKPDGRGLVIVTAHLHYFSA